MIDPTVLIGQPPILWQGEGANYLERHSVVKEPSRSTGLDKPPRPAKYRIDLRAEAVRAAQLLRVPTIHWDDSLSEVRVADSIQPKIFRPSLPPPPGTGPPPGPLVSEHRKQSRGDQTTAIPPFLFRPHPLPELLYKRQPINLEQLRKAIGMGQPAVIDNVVRGLPRNTETPRQINGAHPVFSHQPSNFGMI